MTQYLINNVNYYQYKEGLRVKNQAQIKKELLKFQKHIYIFLIIIQRIAYYKNLKQLREELLQICAQTLLQENKDTEELNMQQNLKDIILQDFKITLP